METTMEEAKQVLEEEKQKRLLECGGKLQALLKEYKCQLLGVPQFTLEKDGTWKILTAVELLAEE